MAEAYNNEPYKSAKEIAARFGVCRNTLITVLKELKCRPSPPHTRRKPIDEEVFFSLVKQLRRGQVTKNQIGETLKVSPSKVQTLLKQYFPYETFQGYARRKASKFDVVKLYKRLGTFKAVADKIKVPYCLVYREYLIQSKDFEKLKKHDYVGLSG